jgi:hypothetical protein
VAAEAAPVASAAFWSPEEFVIAEEFSWLDDPVDWSFGEDFY